ncbi:MAG: hypothetical protein M3545_19030 [Acidobacteriota bacterium]|nr:hypothetical protein [Acidobacteriota bacterium]
MHHCITRALGGDGRDRPDPRLQRPIHYVLPKLLLIATALHETEFEPAPDGSAAEPLADPSRIPAGAAEGTTKVEMVEPEKADERVRTLFESVRERHQHPLVSSYYRGLGNWPDFLDAAWERVRPLVGSDAYEARKGMLIDFARGAVRNLPIAGTAATELPEAQRDEVRALLAALEQVHPGDAPRRRAHQGADRRS